MENQVVESATPSLKIVAGKLLAILVVSAFLTLMACPQFGLRLFFPGNGLMKYFLMISENFSYAFCGALYSVIPFLIARFILKPTEWNFILESRTIFIGGVCIISLGVFAVFGSEVTLYNIALWLFGATISAEAVMVKKYPTSWKELKELL